MSDWIEHAIWWQIYPLGFLGAEPGATDATAVTHRLDRLVTWLDYAVELGASGIALGPIFASSTHGYDTIDYFRVDPRLGNDDDFDALIEAAHRRGLRVLLDGVFNHVGREFPAFRDVLRDGPLAAHARWFKQLPSTGGQAGTEPDYAVFEGHRQLVTLNHDEPEVVQYIAEVMNHWLSRGADGWRLDAAYAVPRSFWAAVLPQVRVLNPQAYIVGEVIHGDYSGIVRKTGMNAVTQYELWKAIWSSLNERNFFELAWALDRHNGFLDKFVPLTFVGNHDVTRIASQLTDDRHLPHALAILLTCGGTPSIYAGDEQAFRAVKEHRAGGDDAIRPAFPASPADLAPYGWPVFRLHQDLIGLRRRHPWLHRARTKNVHVANQKLTLEVRNGDHSLLVALNLGDGASNQPAPWADAVQAGAATLSSPGQAGTHAQLPPHGWAIFSNSH